MTLRTPDDVITSITEELYPFWVFALFDVTWWWLLKIKCSMILFYIPHYCSTPNMVDQRMTLSPKEGCHNSRHHLLSWTCGTEELLVRSIELRFYPPLKTVKRDASIFYMGSTPLNFVSYLQSIQGKHFCFCKLCDVLWFMFSRVYAQFNFLLQGKCCSATVGKLPLCCISLSFVLYLEKV